MAADQDFIIGIDLGTTNSCAAWVNHGKLRVIENSDGDYVTPSFVYFLSPKQPIVGKLALKMSANKPENGVSQIKRFMGRPFYDKELRKSLHHIPFKVVEHNGHSAVHIEDHDLLKTAEEISSLVLQKIKQDASAKFGQDISKAVIAVPAHFNVSQRKATLKAAKMAGFTVMKLLSEPTAAVLNYFFNAKNHIELDNKYWLVYDLGGGTFDVAIAKTEVIDHQQHIKILCADGDSNLGGLIFDNLVQNYFFGQLSARGLTGFKKARDLRRITNACNEAKEVLSTIKETDIRIDGFLNQDYVTVPFTCQEFNKICSDLFQKTLQIVDRCIKKSGIKKQDINEIILAGGSTRITRIQDMLTEYFDGKPLNQTLHLELCVAKGAALQAAMLSNNPTQKEKIEHFDIAEVTSSSLGISDVANKMEFIIRKDTTIPTSGTITYGTIKNKQSALKLDVYAGENINAMRNVFLGTLKITNLTPLPPGKCTVMVTMNVDINGILKVTANETYKENKKDLETDLVLDKAEVLYVETNEDENNKFMKFAELKSYFVQYCEAVKFNLRSEKLQDGHQSVWTLCEEAEEELLQLKSVNDLGRVIELGKTVTCLCHPLVSEFNFQNMPSIEDKYRDIVKVDSTVDNEAFADGRKISNHRD